MTGQEAIKQVLAYVEGKLKSGLPDWDDGGWAFDKAYEGVREFLLDLAEAERVLADQELNGYGDAQ